MSRFPNLLLKNVIIPYKIDESLTPLISDNGISNNDITKLRNSLDLCFDGINDFYKLELTNYIESYISEIDVERTILEEKLELITKGLKKLIKNNPELDFNKENELKIIEKITSEETSVSLNKIILKYYIRQQAFLTEWVKSKRIIIDFNFEEKIKQNLDIKRKTDNLKVKEKKHPQTFDELFKNPKLIQDCIDILKKVEPPILNDNNEYIGKLKGAICIWVDILERKGLIKHISDRKVYSKLIGSKFNFSIDESMFGKIHKRADERYQLDFTTLLSQVSQKENKES